MSKKNKYIRLDCNVVCEQISKGKNEWLEIDLEELQSGHNFHYPFQLDGLPHTITGLNDFKVLSELFAELHAKGYHSLGLSCQEGMYGGIDGIILRVQRTLSND